MKKKIIRFLYHHPFGSVFLRLLTLPIISKLAGGLMDTPLSALLIPRFIKQNNIDLSEYEARKYRSFNDFFTRRKHKDKLSPAGTGDNFISPCEGMLTVYKISSKSRFKIKGFYYTVSDLLATRQMNNRYQGGTCLVFRLDVDNYHRYCYVDDCMKEDNVKLPGVLHTVQDEAHRTLKVFQRNSREYSLLHTRNWGEIIQVEVGALLVGRIVNHHQSGCYRRGQEKGYFKFGGSTIVLLVEKDRVRLDDQIIENSLKGCETPVQYGKIIGFKELQ